MSLYELHHNGAVRPLTDEQVAAYEAEVALRAVLAAGANGGTPDTQSDVYRRWKAKDDHLHSIVKQGGYEAAVAWVHQFFSLVKPVPTQTIAERVTAVGGGR